ncbi:MAG: chromosome partitioning protein [Roseibaca calidilacus]|uniref:Chromosome partitioning protein n=1 Tax=Roseibaca calidilacus TaxID=1666912 RepID=A0A0P7WW74_9RHOB|nr:ParA family protein [Roseibaca calidilacus]KPP95530.1 MAG: chromosome partitioning protein [Roseibaca calidilacus]CUX82139.1 chromosome partitioning protein [Roseibaca calidilacus]
MRVVVQNQKGGVGKTTTVRNLASALLAQGLAKSVVLADLDPQAHLSTMVPIQGTGNTAADWLVGQPVQPAAVEDEIGLSLLPSAEEMPLPVSDLAVPHGDWMIVDTAPGWSDLTVAMCRWADLVLCPLEPDFLGLSGVARLHERFTQHKIAHDKLRFLLCRFSGRLNLHRDVHSRLSARFGAPQLLDVTISNSIRISESAGFGRSVLDHAPDSPCAAEYSALARALAQSPPDNRERSVA